MRNLRSSLALATAALTIASVLTGCTTDGGAPEALPEAVNSTLPTVSDNAGDAPVISTPNGAPPTELVIEDVIERSSLGEFMGTRPSYISVE
jgi:hypothetical protein